MAIVLIIRDKNGKKVAEVPVPPGGIEPEPLAPMAAGEPLSPFALVLQPAKLPGVRSWSIATREPRLLSTVAYRPDGKRLAVGSRDGTVHIWEPETGRLLRVLFSPNDVESLAWSPDERILAVGTTGQDVQLWDANTGRLLRALETLDFICSLAWSPDGRLLRSWGLSQDCYTWEAATGKRLPAPSEIFCALPPAFSPDGRRLAAVARLPINICIWDADTGKEERVLIAPVNSTPPAWSPNGKRLAYGGKDGLRIWDVEAADDDLDDLPIRDLIDKGVSHYAKALALGGDHPPVWSPDGRSLAVSLDRNEGTVLLDAASGAEVRRLDDGGNTGMAWSPDGRTIACINDRESWVRLYDAFTGKRRLSLCEGNVPRGVVEAVDRGRLLGWFSLCEESVLRGVTASPDLQTLAVSDHFDTLLVSTDTGQTRAELKETIWPLAWSPDGKRLAAQGPEHAVQVWQASGKLDLTLGKHKAEVTSLAWSPDGKRLASTAAAEKGVLIWDAVKGERDRELGPFATEARNVKWSADGRLLTFNVPELGWHVWDVQQNKLVNDPKQWKLFWFDLSPDGRSALVAPEETDVYRLRDLASGKDGARLPYIGGPYPHMARTADGTMLAVPHSNNIELWHPNLSKRLRTIPCSIGASLIAFSRDGKWMATLSGERLYVWETDTGRPRGLLLLGRHNNALTLTADGHYSGNEKVDRSIVMVVEKDDGTQETLEPAEFKRKYGFKNEQDKVRLMEK